MAYPSFSDEKIARIIECYLRNNRNIQNTSIQLEVGYNAVSKYVRKWQMGQLSHIQLPPYADAPVEVRAQIENVESISTGDMRRQIVSLRKERDDLMREREQLQKVAAFFEFVKEARMVVPEWVSKRPSRGSKSAIPTALFSDVHLDEVVKPEQVNFVNAYNRAIAEERVKLFFDNTLELSKDYLQGFKYEGFVMPLGGDLFSGIIHEELAETNAATIFESLLYWAEPIASGIRKLRDTFGRVFLPCVVGNHGRRKHKPHAKNRAQDNFDYFFCHLLNKLLANEKGITFAISEASDQPYNVFDTRYLLTHGDQFRGGSGIAGMLSPLMIGDARKRERESAVQRPYDYLVMGHWHQLAFLRGLIVNGSVKGYCEYAFQSNFRYEPPRQAFWITDAHHGVTIQAPIHVAAKNEKYSASTGNQAIVSMG